MAKGTFGERLKRERELREVSVNELTKATRIGPHFLHALENEQWEKLPGGVFNRGFVRAIARYLGLNEEDLLAEYDLAHGEASVSAPAAPESKIPRPPMWIPVVGVLVILGVLAGVVAGAIYGWRRYAAHRAEKKSSSSVALPVQCTLEPHGAKPATQDSPSATAATPLDLPVSTFASTYVRILGDGPLLLDAQMSPRETQHSSARQQFEVSAGDSSAVLLELNGQAMPPVGRQAPPVQ